MRLKTVAVITFCLFFAKVAIAAPLAEPCNLAEDLQRELVTKYPGAHIVGLSDVEKDDRGFFQKDHGNACPGLVSVDFYGDRSPTLALVLTGWGKSKGHTDLVVAHRVGEKWRVAVLDTGANPSPYAPVVWRQPPGEYHDIESNRVIRAKWPVIVFCKYESWAILYAWTGSRVAKVWLSD